MPSDRAHCTSASVCGAADPSTAQTPRQTVGARSGVTGAPGDRSELEGAGGRTDATSQAAPPSLRRARVSWGRGARRLKTSPHWRANSRHMAFGVVAMAWDPPDRTFRAARLGGRDVCRRGTRDAPTAPNPHYAPRVPVAAEDPQPLQRALRRPRSQAGEHAFEVARLAPADVLVVDIHDAQLIGIVPHDDDLGRPARDELAHLDRRVRAQQPPAHSDDQAAGAPVRVGADAEGEHAAHVGELAVQLQLRRMSLLNAQDVCVPQQLPDHRQLAPSHSFRPMEECARIPLRDGEPAAVARARTPTGHPRRRRRGPAAARGSPPCQWPRRRRERCSK